MRVTDEQARILADGDYEPVVQIGIGTTINMAHLAADLLDERAEIERLKARPQPGEGVEEITKALRGVLAEIDYNVDQGVLHRVACVENPTFKKARAVLAALAAAVPAPRWESEEQLAEAMKAEAVGRFGHSIFDGDSWDCIARIALAGPVKP